MTVRTNTRLYHILLRFTCKVFPHEMLKCRRFRTFDGVLAILDVPPFLGIEHKLLTACFTLIFGNPAVTESMGVIVPLISALVWTVKALIVLAIVPLWVSCEITFVEEGLVTVWMNKKEAGVGMMGEHMSLYLTFKCEGTITLRALQVLVFVFILMSW